MKLVIFLPTVLAAVLLCGNCNKRSGRHFGSSVDAPGPPATSAGEWLKRLDDNYRLANGYAELPPQPEWDEILKSLRKPGKDPRTIRLRLFGEVLANDTEAAAQSIRAMLLSQPDELKGYSRKDSLKYLYTFSKDPAETQKWVDESLPKENPDNTKHVSNPDEIAELLKENKIDEAVVKLREKIDGQSDAYDKLNDLGRLATVARLTGRDALYQKTFDELKVASLKIPVDQVYGSYVFYAAFQELARWKDWKTIREIASRYRGKEHEFQGVYLAATYHLEGPAAYLAELKRSPDFGIGDFSEYLQLLSEAPFDDTNHQGELTIRALMASGEKDKARVTLSYLLALEMGNDVLYRAAIEFFPDEAGAMFEAVIPYNLYQERPLIWLADLALQKNDLSRAQSLIDQAIALDPSDGEQGKYTRMQAYDVLSRILRAKGDVAKADFFAKVMQAIRRGEEADDYLHAGLTQEAIRRYEEALGHFKDAYCLQSRLAKTLLSAGKAEEAMVYFEKAFELMPVSFGPVESHCFGCERIFEDARVQEIALKSFNRNIESTPGNPRTFYLLGLLMEEMKRPDEAATAMRKALELDPKYYNCAKHLVALLSQNPAHAKESQSIHLLVAGMAPYAELQQVFRHMTDLRQAWQEAQTPPPSPLKLEPLPLPFVVGKNKESFRNFYTSGGIDALDGWSTAELLTENSFVSWIDNF